MPKQKTHRASAKRFKKTASGELKRHQAYTGHRFHGKTKKQRRHLRKAAMVSASDLRRIRQCFPKCVNYKLKRLLRRNFRCQELKVEP